MDPKYSVIKGMHYSGLVANMTVGPTHKILVLITYIEDLTGVLMFY